MGGEIGEDSHKKPHKIRKSGAKLKKKEAKDKKERHNPKAFTFSGGVKSVQKKVQRTLDIQTKKEKYHLVVDKTPELNSPPYIVVVQGPPGVGKSTLIKSLVKRYTNHKVSVVKGPITLVSSKGRRLTFIECPSDMPSMLDLAKIADLVLLMIDGSFGFEMETFEFLNTLQVHGFPRILGILTHLDQLGDNASLRKVKKKLKNRFWAEIYDGAKLFYLSGLQYDRYNKTEILNLSRFISVQKFSPLLFRSQHPYVLSLRTEDHTPASLISRRKDGKEKEAEGEEGEDAGGIDRPRTVYFYGYVKGCNMKSGTDIHIPGAGDFKIKSIDEYVDPCPLPNEGLQNKNDSGRLLRTLKKSETRIYAPDCDIGNVSYDKDGMYIHIPEHKIGFTRKEDIQAYPSTKKSGAANDDDDQEEVSSSSDGEGDESGEGSTRDSSDESSEDNDDDDEDDSSNGKDRNEDEKSLPEAVSLIRSLQQADGALDDSVKQRSLQLLPTSKRCLMTSNLISNPPDQQRSVPTISSPTTSLTALENSSLPSSDNKIAEGKCGGREEGSSGNGRERRRVPENINTSDSDSSEDSCDVSDKEKREIICGDNDSDSDDFDDDGIQQGSGGGREGNGSYLRGTGVMMMIEKGD